MHKITRLAALSLITASVWAAEFQNGQAARAVIGQSSFSSRETTISPNVLALSSGWLYAADASGRLLTFDLSQIPGPRDEPVAKGESSCPLCGFSVGAINSYGVQPGVAGVSIHGKTVIATDPQNHRVLIWRDSSLPRASQGPDTVLGRNVGEGVSASTIVDPVSAAFDGKRLFIGDAALHRILIWNSLPASDTQPADAVLGQQNFNSTAASDVPGADNINRPSSMVSDGVNLFVADATAHRILVFTAGDLPLPGYSVLNSASLAAGPLAPGTLATIAATGFGPSVASASEGEQPLPNELAGTEVFLNGTKLPLLSASSSEIRVQLPYPIETPSSASLYVRVKHADGTVIVSNAVALKLQAAAPGLFAFGGSEPRPGMVLHALSGTPVTAESPAQPGEMLVLWTTGLGAVNDGDAAEPVTAGQPFAGPAAPTLYAVSALVSGRSAPVVAAELPQGSIGIYQVRIVLPSDLPDDPHTPVLLSQEGTVSNTVTIPVRNSIH